MDLNELLCAHQLELMRASASGDASTRQGHFARVARYAELIRKLRDSHQKPSPAARPASPEAVIYGTYAGDSAPYPGGDTLECWESEGGALHSPRPQISSGTTTKLMRVSRSVI